MSAAAAAKSKNPIWKFAGAAAIGDFELTGVADRIDILKSGGAAILDYKTGRPPSPPHIRELLTPQLPLEAAILAAGGFPGLGSLRGGRIDLSAAVGRPRRQ